MGTKPMTQQELFKANNPDLRGSLPAMLRAAELARQTAIQTNTAIIVVQNGKPVRIPADELRKEPKQP
jgi:hypothetical protein